MSIQHEIRRMLWNVGYDIIKFTPKFHPLARRRQILNAYGIDTVLDVGANTGQFAQQLRHDIGYVKRIISFEPLSSAFKLLKAKAKGDAAWDIFNFALGDTEAKQEINIADNSCCSSLLNMLSSHEKYIPRSKYIGTEMINVKTLDSIFCNLCKPVNRVYLKIDTQGFENKVIKGAEKSLEQIDTIQMEMSLVPLYEDGLLFNDMYSLMAEKGYSLIAIETGFSYQTTGQILKVDGIFHRLQL